MLLTKWALRTLVACSPLIMAACATSPPAVTAPAPVDAASAADLGPYKIGSPYQVEGVWYYPAEDYSYVEEGIASWYGPDFHGKRTANGERYDMNAITAAHPTLPLSSMVKVTNLDNGRVLNLRVNDRGPFHSRRIIDVSRRAAQLLGFYEAGTARVRVEIDPVESMNLKNLALKKYPQDMPQIAAVPRPSVSSTSLEPLSIPAGSVQAVVAEPKPKAKPPASAAKKPPVQTAEKTPPPARALVVSSGIFIQAGAFAEEANARRLEQQLGELGSVHIMPATVNDARVYRVRLGPVADEAAANTLLAQVKSYGYDDAQVVRE